MAQVQKEYGVTLISDSLPGKRGKGKPDLNSSLFLQDLSKMISENLELLMTFLNCELKLRKAGINYWLLNQANGWFMEVDVAGVKLHLPEQRKKWLLAAWAVMMCAELQTEFPYNKYSLEERANLKESCLHRYQDSYKQIRQTRTILEEAKMETCFPAMHLLPQMAMERLSLHHELVVRNIGVERAQEFKTSGISVDLRLGSVKRHFDQAHWHNVEEDHLVHLLWNLMAIYHTVIAFTPKSDLGDDSMV